jgi:hypothetical protein
MRSWHWNSLNGHQHFIYPLVEEAEVARAQVRSRWLAALFPRQARVERLLWRECGFELRPNAVRR